MRMSFGAAGYASLAQATSSAIASGSISGWIKAALALIASQNTSTATSHLQGATSSSETMRQDWLGRLVESSDSFGKHIVYGYNDADEQIRISDLALNKQADYGYDALGRRTHETLSKGGLIQRQQTNVYNNQGWLTEVSAQAGYDAGGGAAINQQLHVQYQLDAQGNRVRILAEDGSQAVYGYDASGRMLQGRDDKVGTEPQDADQVVSSLVYDGYGNRISETRSGTTTTYTYDAGNRVKTSSAGETFTYDANGNTTDQRVRSEKNELLRTQTTYNAENRATVTISTDKEGKNTTSSNTYDAVGNVVNTRIKSETSSFNEVTKRDVRYLEQSKTIANGKAKGTAGLRGATAFTYDANGNLVYLDRGVNQQTKQRSVAVFEYDLEGQIIGRADKAGALAGTSAGADLFQGYTIDPETDALDGSAAGSGWNFRLRSIMDGLREQYDGSGAQVQSYLYANNKSLAQAQGTQGVNLVKLTLSGAAPIIQTTSSGGGGSGIGESGNAEPVSVDTVVGWRLTLAESDIVRDGAGQVDRAATARRIAQAHYGNFSTLSEAAQAKVVAYVQSSLPATIAAGTTVDLHGYIVLADGGMRDVTQITDYSVKRIGLDGMPAGSIQSHVVRAGDTLQSIAQIYFGSPSYWYLIADANGLQGHEALQEGTTITIPNKVVNAANTSDTFKVYNESEIIGSTSPEIRTIKKKKKWYQKLVQIIIVVIMVVAAIVVAVYAPGLLAQYGAVMGSLYAAAFGAAVMATASIVTQGLAIAADLQDGFSWKQVGKAAISGAASGLAAGWAAQVATGNALLDATAKVAIEAGRQRVVDGRVSSVAGLAAAAFGLKGVQSAGLRMLEGKVRGRGDNAQDWVSLVSAAFFEVSGASGQLVQAGQINWTAVAVQAIGAAIVTDRRGGDAGRAYIGQAIGNSFQGTIEADAQQRFAPNQSAAETARLSRRNQALANAQTAQQNRNQYGQDGTGDVLSNHNGERLDMPVEPSGPTPEQSRDALRQMDRGVSVAGNGYTAKAGDNISKIIGTSDPQAIGNFMRANNLTSDRIDIGRNYFVPEDRNAYGDAGALGQATLDVGNARIERLAAERAAAAAMTDPNNPANWRSASARYQTAQAGGVVWREGARYASTATGNDAGVDMLANLTPEFGGYSGEPAETSPLLARAFGGAVGVTKFFAKSADATVRMGGNVVLQIGDILTLGINHDAPIIQQAWIEQGALAAGVGKFVTQPRAMLTDTFENIGNTFERANQLDAQGRYMEAAEVRSEQSSSIAATLLGGAQTVRSAASTGAAGLRSMGAQDYAFVESKGLTGGLSLNQRGAVDLFDLEPIPSRSLAAQADEFVGPRKPENWDDLVSHPNAHAFSVHGGSVSEGAVMNRARTGVKPNGDVGPIPPMSSVFYSDDLLIQADNSIRTSGGLSNAITRQPGESVVRVLTDDVGDLGVSLGYGYVRPGHTGSKAFNATVEGPLQRIDNLRSAQGIYVLNPTTGKWETITVYPAPF
jgi:YD repeat-containing protein